MNTRTEGDTLSYEEVLTEIITDVTAPSAADEATEISALHTRNFM